LEGLAGWKVVLAGRSCWLEGLAGWKLAHICEADPGGPTHAAACFREIVRRVRIADGNS
jgi:hypothetical protein